MYCNNNILEVKKVLPLCGVLANKSSITFSKFLFPIINKEVGKSWLHFSRNFELKYQKSLQSTLPILLSINKSNFYNSLENKRTKLKKHLNNNYSRFFSNKNKTNVKFGISAGLVSLLLYILNLIKDKNENEEFFKLGFGSNVATKYILNIINDPKIEDSLKKLFKRILTSLIKDEDFSKDWKLGLRHIIKECEDEIGHNLTNILKTKIVQDWLYSTTNEIVDYMSRTPEVISKTSSLFSEAFNHQIFTENSKKWLEEFIHNCVINNKKIINSINHLLIRIFNTKDIQNNLGDLFKDVILNDSTQDYISLAFWNVIRKSLIFPKNWFNGIKNSEKQLKDINTPKKGLENN